MATCHALRVPCLTARRRSSVVCKSTTFFSRFVSPSAPSSTGMGRGDGSRGAVVVVAPSSRRRRRGFCALVTAAAAADARAAAPDGSIDKPKHDAELAARRDEMVSGCTECTMPSEGDRAVTLAKAALNGRAASDLGEGSSLRVLVVGAETGKLAAALAASGASHVLVVDHSQVCPPRRSARESGRKERRKNKTLPTRLGTTFYVFVFSPQIVASRRPHVR